MILNIQPAQLDDPQLATILGLLGQGGPTQVLAPGIFQIPHFNGGYVLPQEYNWAEYPADLSIYCYGVCDSHTQVLDLCPELQDPNRQFALILTEVRREDQAPDGGWRWHKWGPYIGTHEQQCEYLYDEVGIDVVYCYHIYEAVQD